MTIPVTGVGITMPEGAGAWNRPQAYSRATLPPGPLPYALDLDDHRRIRWAGGAVTTELVLLGYLPSTTGAGVFGARAEHAIKSFQRYAKLKDDGIAGPATLRMLCWEFLNDMERQLGIKHHLLYGQLAHESGFDPGAQGTKRDNGTDMGIPQINDRSFPHISPALAYGDIRFGIRFSASGLIESGHPDENRTYAELGRWDCAVLHHNSPRNARRLFETGQYPTHQAADYTYKVAVAANDHP